MNVKKNRLEWIVFAVGLVLVLAVLGWLVALAVTHDGSDVGLTVEIEEATERGVKLRIANDGDQTATDVEVRVQLRRGAQIVDEAVVVVPHVPHHSARETEVDFPHKQPGDRVEIGPITWAPA